MKRKILQSYAQNLAEMVVGYKLSTEDLEKISDLPDGTISIDLIGRTTTFGSKILDLEIVETLHEWLSSQLSSEDLTLSNLKKCDVEVSFKTDRAPTDRSKIVNFDFKNRCVISTDEKEYVGEASTSKTYKRNEGFVS